MTKDLRKESVIVMVVSPAKTLDYEGVDFDQYTEPALLPQSQALVDELRQLDPAGISSLMKVSDKLAQLNYDRYQSFSVPFDADNSKQALLVFKGDVYKGIAVEDYDADDLTFAQAHLRILSGLYGVLRPLDLMQPYRLEMGTKLATERGKNLYEFWGDRISERLNADFAKADDPCLVNLASNEYFKSIDRSTLKARILNVAFKEHKDGKYKVIGIHAKRARGLMVDYVIRHRITDPEQMKAFDTEGYDYAPSLSSEDEWVFTRG